MNDSFRLALEKHQQGFPDQAAQLWVLVARPRPVGEALESGLHSGR